MIALKGFLPPIMELLMVIAVMPVNENFQCLGRGSRQLVDILINI